MNDVRGSARLLVAAADRLANAAARRIELGHIDARSEIGDALLDYDGLDDHRIALGLEQRRDEADEGRKPQKGDDAYAFRASIRIECSACGAALGFRCPTIGDRPDQPAVSPNALELRVPLISPAELELLGPLAAMRSSDGLPWFSVRRRA